MRNGRSGNPEDDSSGWRDESPYRFETGLVRFDLGAKDIASFSYRRSRSFYIGMKNISRSISIVIMSAALLMGARVLAEVSGLDHLEQVDVTNCKSDDDEKPRQTPVGPICSYVHKLCDVSAGGKTIFQGVYIDVDCVPSDPSVCPKIGECAKRKLPQKVAEYVRALNDPNSSRADGAGLEMNLKDFGGVR